MIVKGKNIKCYKRDRTLTLSFLIRNLKLVPDRFVADIEIKNIRKVKKC